ncbi:D-glycero-alpha-D-manno-heptose-1,7-bisphosphate 7-phosphatase [Bacteroidota bacterium]
MNRAIFFDRDGVINYEVGDYVYLIEKFRLNDGVIDCLRFFQDKGYFIFIITNQGGINKKLYSIEDVEILHEHMLNLLKYKGISIDEVYFCPHHSEYERCICRKPDSLMIEKAMARFSINPSMSYFIGDKVTDFEAGEKAGLKSVRIIKNENLMKNEEIIAIMNSFNE